MRIAISSGHGLHVRGASSLIDEVDEARRVVNRLGEIMPDAVVFHDNVSRTKADNVNALVNWHNYQERDLDAQIHFNGIEGVQIAGIGVETLHRDGNAETRGLASRISRGISEVSGLILRRGDGTWARNDVGFLTRTNIDRAVLPEICFVNSRTDVRLYKDNFEAICQSIARTLTGQQSQAAAAPALPPPPASPPAPAAGRNFRVLVGAFDTDKEARAARDEIIRQVPRHSDAFIVQSGYVWQVQIASGPNLCGAERIARELFEEGIMCVTVV